MGVVAPGKKNELKSMWTEAVVTYFEEQPEENYENLSGYTVSGPRLELVICRVRRRHANHPAVTSVFLK